MDPISGIAVDALLLRTRLPEVALRPGVSVVARVASRGQEQGVIVLAGVPLTATLPDEVQAGETLRLTVSEVTPERVVMRMEAPPVGLPPPPTQAAPARVEVQERPRRSKRGGEETASVALTFESARLGRLDLRLELRAGELRATVATPAGRAFELAGAHAEQLRSDLAEKTGLRSAVSVIPRRDPLDVYA